MQALLSMSLQEFFDHLEAITIYEDMEIAEHKDHELEMKRNSGRNR